MIKFLTDENISKSLVAALRAAKINVVRIADVNLQGSPDDNIFQYSKAQNLTLLTRDLDFANIHRFPLGTHSGVVVIRFENAAPIDTLSKRVITALLELKEDEIFGNLIVISPQSLRIRKKI